MEFETAHGPTVRLDWHNPTELSGIKVCITSTVGHEAGCWGGCEAAKDGKRTLQGNLYDLEGVVRSAMERNKSAIEAILCYCKGERDSDPCGACKSADRNPFGGCFTYSGEFGGTCAYCLFAGLCVRCDKTNLIDLTGDSEGDD